jgi:TetR/AcrR family transcriptional regulator, repressor for uid operon
MVMLPSGQAGDGLTERGRQREETRRRVREVALDVIRRDGLADAKVDEIARIAGVSRGTVYFHYPTKEHVVAEVLAEAEGRVAEAIAEVPRGAPIAEVLEAFCAAFAREWDRESQLFPSVATVAVRGAAVTMRSKELDPVHRVLAARFKSAGERGELTSAVRSTVLANVFLVHVLTATLAWSSKPRPRLATALGDVTEIFLNGARAPRR